MRKRIIARLDIKGENVVRGIHLEGLRVVGRPEQMARDYAAQGIDEIIFIDTVASLYGRNNTLPVIEKTSESVFIPLTVGGGVRSLKDVENILRSGADKITLNSAAVQNPYLITEIAKTFGSQCVVVAIEAKRQSSDQWTVLVENGRQTTDLDAIEWAKKVWELGAGELLVTSIDQDGTKKGFDINLTRRITEIVSIPVIASGGAGRGEHLVDIFQHADAVALGSILHFKLSTIFEIKKLLKEVGISVRP